MQIYFHVYLFRLQKGCLQSFDNSDGKCEFIVPWSILGRTLELFFEFFFSCFFALVSKTVKLQKLVSVLTIYFTIFEIGLKALVYMSSMKWMFCEKIHKFHRKAPESQACNFI